MLAEAPMSAMALTNSCASSRRPCSSRREPPVRAKFSNPARYGGGAGGGSCRAERLGVKGWAGKQHGCEQAYTQQAGLTTDARSSLGAGGTHPAHAPFGPFSTCLETPGTANWNSETGAVVEPVERAVSPDEPSVSVARFFSGAESCRAARILERSWACARSAAGCRYNGGGGGISSNTQCENQKREGSRSTRCSGTAAQHTSACVCAEQHPRPHHQRTQQEVEEEELLAPPRPR